MRRKLLSLLLIGAMSLSLIACGGGNKKEEATSTNSETVTEEEPLMEVVEEEIERGEVVEENTGYARSAKWDEIDAPYMAIQVQDYFFETGMTVGELYDMLEESGKEFIWEKNTESQTYKPDEMRKADGASYVLRIDIGPEVDISFTNPYDYEIPYKDCICTSFLAPLRSADNFFFGYNGMNEILYKWTVDDIKVMMEPGGIFEGFEIVNESPYFFDIANTNINHEYFDGCQISFQVYEKEVEYISIQFSNEKLGEGYY